MIVNDERIAKSQTEAFFKSLHSSYETRIGSHQRFWGEVRRIVLRLQQRHKITGKMIFQMSQDFNKIIKSELKPIYHDRVNDGLSNTHLGINYIRFILKDEVTHDSAIKIVAFYINTSEI